jgi:hypothetical protein
MCHTIHEKSLKQEQVKHTFTHKEDPMHIISDQQTFLNFKINKMEPSSSFLKIIRYLFHYDLRMSATFSIMNHGCSLLFPL